MSELLVQLEPRLPRRENALDEVLVGMEGLAKNGDELGFGRLRILSLMLPAGVLRIEGV